MMIKQQILIILSLFNLAAYATSMLVDPLETPSHKTVIDNFLETAVNKIKKHSINSVNEDGYTLLQQALINNAYIEEQVSHLNGNNGSTNDTLNTSIVIINILLNNGADPNMPFPAKGGFYKDGQHFLIKASQLNGNPRFPLHIIELLFKHGLSPQAQDANGNTGLMRLITSLHLWKKIPEYREGFIKLITDYTTDFSIQNNRGDTVLHLTSAFNDLKTAQLILQRPVQWDIRNFQEKTPMQIARSMAGSFPGDSRDFRWYWYISLFSSNYKMIRLLEKAGKLQSVNNSDFLLHDKNAACERSFNGHTGSN